MPDSIRERIAVKLDHAELLKLREMRRRIADALPVCDEADACGCNMDGPRNALKMMDTQFAEIETRFMPHLAASSHDE
jgi:hypothetical protein